MRGHKRAISEHVGSSCFADSSCPRGVIEILQKLICENLLQEASKVFPEVHLSSPRPKQILNSDVAPMQRLRREVMPLLPLEEVEGDRMAVTAENRLQFVTSRGRMKMSREEAYELGGETSPRFVAPRHRRVPCTGESESESERWAKTSKHYWVVSMCTLAHLCVSFVYVVYRAALAP